jgi:hypothetical protein
MVDGTLMVPRSVAAALADLADCNSAGRTDWKSVFRRNLRAT